MSNSLVIKIEEVLAMVEPLYEFSCYELNGKLVADQSEVGFHPEDMERFTKLALEVYCEAVQNNLVQELPEPCPQYPTKLSIPGHWNDDLSYTVYRAEKWLDCLRATMRLAAKQPTVGSTVATAVWLGKGRVRVGDKTISLESQPADVLQALVELGSATKPQLIKKSGREDAPKILKRIADKFPELAAHIHFPGKRGYGGYSATIKVEGS